MSTPDLSQLSGAQQEALQQYTAVTDQDHLAAIPMLQRSEWNVQIAISRFFDGEPATDPLAEARQAASVPAPSSRQTTNLQYESLLGQMNGSLPVQRVSPDNVVRRVDTTGAIVPAYQPPFLLSILFAPFNLLLKVFSTVFSPLSFLVPSFASRFYQNLFSLSSRPSRRLLPPADTARRFIREFEEIYSPNPPLPFVESGFNLALDSCKKDSKFLLVVLISPSHDDTHSWVRDTLMSSQLNQFLQTHHSEVVLWGGNVQDAESYQVSVSLNCTKFPFAALVCQTTESTGTSTRPGEMSVVMRATGPLSPNDLVAKLVAAMTAQQAQLNASRAQRAEQQAQRSLRDEQDTAYERSLAQDRERVRRKREEEAAQAQAEKEAQDAVDQQMQLEAQREQWRHWRAKQVLPEPDSKAPNAVAVSLRLQGGQRLVRRFDKDSSLEQLYAFVECNDLLGVQDDAMTPTAPPTGYEHSYQFRLVSPMPRTVIDPTPEGTIGSMVGRGANLIVEGLDDAE